ncbi:hypothetical protein D9757_011119 [Collybiopsis confluens]|uniref:RNase III domain-containing protein n=1 Tax=Collybiopsis confluens TaxID=2823264 RepID=A0A8H5GX17_9AGAR|nr:hypothetical protein D9757_011119 [Collybiopsis confluens]
MLLKDELAPSLPTIEGGNVDVRDLTLALYTHHPPPGFSSDRLAQLGKMVLGLVITDHLFKTQPLVGGDAIETKRDGMLKEESVLEWLDLYPDEKERFMQRNGEDAPQDSRELYDFFLSYVGAVYLCQGRSIHPVLENWIIGLVSLERDGPPTAGENSASGSSSESADRDPPPPDYSMSSPTLATPPLSPSIQPTRSPTITISTTNVTPTATSLRSPDNDTFSTRLGPSSATPRITVEMMNTLASQKHVRIEYPSEQSGLAHQPEWRVRCTSTYYIRSMVYV